MAANVPSYYEYLSSIGDLSSTYPFSYSAEQAVFNFGNTIVQAIDFDPYLFNPYELGIGGDSIPVEEMPEYPALISSMGRVIGGPRFHEWIKDHEQEVSETYKVMISAFKIFMPDLPKDLTKRSSIHVGFNSGITRDGELGLQVLGDCACSGATPYGHGISGKYEAGFAEYDLHNADSQAQRVSLYAGLGHIASLVLVN